MNQRDRIFVRELVAEQVRDAERRILREVGDAIAEIRDELNTEVGDINRRLTDVHRRALRALTDRLERNTPA